MTSIWNKVLLSQYTATLEMFGEAISACPDNLWKRSMWNDPTMQPEFSEFWYVAYHTLFWLDLYLTGSSVGFSPPAPFTLDELDPRGLLPGRVYTKAELLSYLAYCREKSGEVIESLTDRKALRKCYFPWSKGKLTFAELLLNNMRHAQEHGAQLRIFIGQQAGITSSWIGQARVG